MRRARLLILGFEKMCLILNTSKKTNLGNFSCFFSKFLMNVYKIIKIFEKTSYFLQFSLFQTTEMYGKVTFLYRVQKIRNRLNPR